MTDVHDLVGIGVGPFNLSIAALADDQPTIDARFLEADAEFRWHPGMLLPDARLQMSPLKDLVTGVDPTNPHSFLNYLVSQGRFYPWLHAELPAVSRQEYEDYMRWVAHGLDDVAFDHRVRALTHDRQAFEIHAEGQREPVRARSVVLGVGQRPSLPACVDEPPGPRAFHSSTIAHREPSLEDQRVAVIGGGQSGAEVFETILDERWGTPARLDWYTRRPNFQSLDDVAFTNEYFTPDYVEAFYEAPAERKREIVEEQKLASDGISPEDLRSIYRRVYEKRAVSEGRPEVNLRPGRELVQHRGGPPHRLVLDNHLTGDTETARADVVVFCTGYAYRVPDLLDPIADLLERREDQPFQLDADFRVQWDGPEGLDLFAVNAGRYSHGIAEPQMSLMAWRGARILEAVAGEELFDTSDPMSMVEWSSEEAPTDAQLGAPLPEAGRRRS